MFHVEHLKMFHVEHLKQKNEMNKKTVKSTCFNVITLLLVVVIVYVLFALQSCSTYKKIDINGKATIVTTDTTYINHKTLLKYPKK